MMAEHESIPSCPDQPLQQQPYGKLISLLVRYNALLRTVLLVGCAFGTAILSHPQLTNKLSIHENAMSPAMKRSFLAPDERKKIMEYGSIAERENFKGEVNKHKRIARLPQHTVGVLGWAHRELLRLGLEVHLQNYTVTDVISGASTQRTNLYAIKWAMRTDRSECMLLHATDTTSTSSGLAVGMMAYATKQNIWSKNVVLLLTADRYTGVEAFVGAYFNKHAGHGIVGGPLPVHAGAIHSAVSIDIDKSRFKNLVVRINGFNGQKPNLDFVQAAQAIAARFALPLRFPYLNGDWLFGHHGTGAHGVLLHHGIEAITIASSVERGKRKIEEDAASMIEQLFFVVNNLSQHFNQCFYYYLFTHCGYNASNTFAPLQLYIAPVVALVLYLCVGAVGLFYTAPGITKSPGSSGTPSVVSAATLTSGSSASSPTASAQTRMVSGRIVAPGRTAGIVLLTVYGLAAATLWAPAVFGPTVYGGVAQWHHEHVSPRPRTGDLWTVSLARLVTPHTATFLCCLLGAGLWSSVTFAGVLRCVRGPDAGAWRLITSVVYMCTSACLGPVAALNPPLALGTAVLVVPLLELLHTLSSHPPDNWWHTLEQMLTAALVLCLWSPVGIVSLASAFSGEAGYSDDLVRAYALAFLHGAWQFPVVFMAYIPVYTLACVSVLQRWS